MDLMSLKKELNAEELTLVNMELERQKKSSSVMWLLWLFTGGIGGHRYYLGDIGMGIAMTLTIGGLGVWTLIDAFFISKRLLLKNTDLEMQIIEKLKKMHPAA